MRLTHPSLPGRVVDVPSARSARVLARSGWRPLAKTPPPVVEAPAPTPVEAPSPAQKATPTTPTKEV